MGDWSCKPGPDCFTCPLPDCNCDLFKRRAEGELSKAGNTKQVGFKVIDVWRCSDLGHYSPIPGRGPNDEEVLQGDVRTTVVSKEEIEALLAREFPGKIAPISEPLDKTPKGGRTHIGIGRKVVEFPRRGAEGGGSA